VPVLADWSVPTLAAALAEDVPCFYVLANTRALAPPQAAARAEEIGRNLRLAACSLGLDPVTQLSVVSRGDSTLRGHYPLETDALATGLGLAAPATLLMPYFAEGGRLTAHDVHYVATNEAPESSRRGTDGADDAVRLTPVGDTEFARDKAFGYTASHLPSWVEEKTGAKVLAGSVATLSLEVLRSPGGADAVAATLAALPRGGQGAVVVANALDAADAAVVALGVLRAQAGAAAGSGALAGGLLFRSAGGLVAALAAIPPRPLLSAEELRCTGRHVTTGAAAGSEAGLVVVGSYVGKSSTQLAALRRLCPWIEPVELKVAALLSPSSGGGGPAGEVARVQATVAGALRRGQSVVLYTSRELSQDDGAAKGLASGAVVGGALVDVVRGVIRGGGGSSGGHEQKGLAPQPAFLIAKGGITSNDVAVDALGVTRAEVLGCVVPGVPVWRCGPDSAAPGLAYVVFPGNVGLEDDLARVASIMSGRPLGTADLCTAAGGGGAMGGGVGEPASLFPDPSLADEHAGAGGSGAGKASCEWEVSSDEAWEGDGDDDGDDDVEALLAELRSLTAKQAGAQAGADAGAEAEGAKGPAVGPGERLLNMFGEGGGGGGGRPTAQRRVGASGAWVGPGSGGLSFDGTVADLLREARAAGRAVTQQHA